MAGGWYAWETLRRSILNGHGWACCLTHWLPSCRWQLSRQNSRGIITRGSRPYFEVSTGYTYFEENDLLFSKITPCLQNGKHALATGLEGEFGFGTTEFHVVRAGSSLVAPYMSRVLTQAHIINHCAKNFTGTAGQQRVQPETLNSLPILLPPLPEQRAIAAVLDSIDDAIERTEAVIAATEQLRDSLLHQLLTRGVPGWHTEWKDVPALGTIPEDWGVVRLGEVATLQRGMDLPEDDRISGSVPVYGSNGIHGFHDSSPVNGPGVITGRSGSIGLVHYCESSFWPLNTTLFVKDFHGNNERFIFHFLSHLQLERFAASTGVPSLNRNFVHPTPVGVPPLSEQQAIVRLLDGVDEAVAGAKRERDGLKLVKESTADALLTGRMRVG